jgi:hypothetical protein
VRVGTPGAAAHSVVQVRNSIIANSTGGTSANCSGTSITDQGNNLAFPGTTCGFSLASDRRADPKLGPLATNGGRTQTMALLPGSPAIDAGDDATCNAAPVSGVDQRGVNRFTSAGAHCDMGAFERGGTATFTDDPLSAGLTAIKAVHITELRSRIDAARIARGLAAYSWTDPTLIPGSILKAQHIIDLRNALSEAYGAAGLTQPTYTDSELTIGVTTVIVAHIAQVRAAVAAIE